jgi:hypothetical protein
MKRSQLSEAQIIKIIASQESASKSATNRTAEHYAQY